MSDLSALETKTEFEGQKKLINELRNHLEDAEYKLIEGEKLRKRLHNTILVIFSDLKLQAEISDTFTEKKSLMLQELKGNIRVFCRVRPLLPDDSSGSEGKLISYPTTTEALGRGIDITQNGRF